MLFDSDNENGIIINARDLYVLYCGVKWDLIEHAKEISKSDKLIGRCGSYYFYLNNEGRRYCIYDWGDM